MKARFSRLIFSFITMGILLSATGCVTPQRYVRWYDGPPKETNQVALLKIPKSVWHGPILTVTKIDGRAVSRPQAFAEQLELLAEEHRLWVAYQKGGSRSVRDGEISFRPEMGKTYELNAAEEDRSFGKSLRQGLLFQHWGWTIWIVDADSKKVVAGTPRETPQHWYE